MDETLFRFRFYWTMHLKNCFEKLKISMFICIYIISAIAFCDFDKLQVARRRILRGHTFPNAGGDKWAKLDKVA